MTNNPSGISRRTLLKGLAASAAVPMAGCSPNPASPPLAAPYVPGKPLPWINWGKNHSCYPSQRLAPRNEQQLLQGLTQAKGTVRAVGSSHAFSALVPTDDTLLTTDYLSGLISHDPATLQAEVWGGTRLHSLGPLLESVGLATQNLPDMDYPSLAGAIATSTHGTGKHFGSLSTQVAGLTLATVDGQLLDVSTQQHPQIFSAARTHLGALGIVSRVRLQCQSAYRLTEVSQVEPLELLLSERRGSRCLEPATSGIRICLLATWSRGVSVCLVAGQSLWRQPASSSNRPLLSGAGPCQNHALL